MTKKKQNKSKKIKAYTLYEKLAEQYELTKEQIHNWLDYNESRDNIITQNGGEGVRLTKQQYQEFLDESIAIYKSKKIAKALPLIQKFLYKWRKYFLKPPYDPIDDKGSARTYKTFLIDLATKEKLPLTIHIDDYPDTYLGILQLVDDLKKSLINKEVPKELPREPITLREFIEIALGIYRARNTNLRRRLSKYKTTGRIEYPNEVGKANRGHSKRYNATDLYFCYKQWRQDMPSLPSLKSAS